MLQHLSILFLVIYTLFVIFIGIKNSRAKDSSDYFLASHQLPAWLLAITFIASWWGGGSAIDLVDHAHNKGLASFWIYGVPVLISTAIMFFLAQKIRSANTLSQPELFGRRYNKTAGAILTLFILVYMILGGAVQVIVVGHFFQSFFHLSYTQGAIIGTSIVLLYSMFGGFKGVVLTDFLQFIFFVIGGFALFLYAYHQSGGLTAVVQHAEEIGKSDYNSFWKHGSDYLAYIITFGTSWTIQANVWQRISAAKNAKSARKMMLISFFAFIPLYLMVTYTGMFTSTLYDKVPEGGIVPHLITNLSSPVWSALIFVGLCSAIMSTMDSMFNTGALSLTIDIYQKYISPKSSPRKIVTVGRISTLIVGFIALYIGLQIESVLTISWIGADFLATGAFIPIIFGFIWKKRSHKATIVSMVFGFIFSMYNLLSALGVSLPVAWEIASVQQALIGMCISLVLYVSISFIEDYSTVNSLKTP
jgi:SSS family solute:Na+ symporter